jgi:hypothetical protein
MNMSLEQVRDDIRAQEVYVGGVTVHPSIFKKWADAIDSHLDRDPVRVAEEAICKLHELACEHGDTDDNGTGYDFSMEQFDEFARAALESFAASLPVAAKMPDDDALAAVCDHFMIGAQARSKSTILANVDNVIRRSRCLSAIEREFFTIEVPDEDGDEDDTFESCSLPWGADPSEYVEQFRTALLAKGNSGVRGGWLPIETAPKGLGDYLVYQPKHGERHVLPARICFARDAGEVRKNTHWMPIPAAPQPDDAEGK